MSRLTEKEVEIIRTVRNRRQRQQLHAAQIIQNARQLRSETIVGLLAGAASALATWTGLAALGSTIDKAVARPVRRRSTVRELNRLHDRLLKDIGLERDMIETFVDSLAAKETEPTREGHAPVKGLRYWLQRRRSIHELEGLDDRLLEDIGIERSGIPAAVDRAMEKVETKTCPASRVSAAQVQSLTQQALGTLPPLRRRPAERAVAAAKQAPVLPMWLGPWLNLSPGYHAR